MIDYSQNSIFLHLVFQSILVLKRTLFFSRAYSLNSRASSLSFHVVYTSVFSHRNQLTAPDLVSATTPNVPRGLGGRGGGNEIVASGGLPYRPPSVDPFSEPMMPERYMTANRQHLPNQQIPPSQQQQQQPRPQQGSLSTLLSLNQHHRTSSPLGTVIVALFVF